MTNTEQNIQVAQSMYACFQRGDIPALLDQVEESIEWITPGPKPFGGTWHGKAGVADFFRMVSETWDFQAFEPREFVASGDNVVVLGRYAMTARGTGRPASSDWAMHFTIRNGKCARFQEYTDSAALSDAMAAGAAA